MKTVCASGASVPIIDVSHYAPHEDWNAARASGIVGMFAKSSQGSGVIDATFVSHCKAAKIAGLKTGAYHYFEAGVDPAVQAKLFIRMLSAVDPLDFPPVLDWESLDGGPSIQQDIQSALVFLDLIEKASGKTPIIYSGPYFLQSLGLTPDFAKYPLWVSHYGVRCPMVPSPWDKWTFWQSTDKFKLSNGVYVDAGTFNGSLQQLEGMIWTSTPSSTVPQV